MNPPAPIRAGQSPARAAQLAAVGERMLLRSDRVADRVFDLILAEVPGYAERSPEFLADVKALARRNSVMEATALAGRGRLDRQALEYVAEHVRSRIRHGMPLETLLRAYRIGATGFWESAMDEAAELGLSRDDTVEVGRMVFEIMDAITTHVAETYLREEARLRARTVQAARDLIDLLLLGELDSEFPGRHPAAPSLDPRASLMVVIGWIADLQDSAAETLALATRVVAERLASGGVTPVVVARQQSVVAICAAIETPSTRVAQARAELLGAHRIELRFGISAPCAGFSGVPGAFEQAELAVAQAGPGGPVLSLSELPSATYALITAPATTRAVIAQRGDALANLDPATATAIRQTVAAFADASMSIAHAADALHVHPNTLRHRLRRIEERTGLDPQRFADLVELLLVLDARARTAAA